MRASCQRPGLLIPFAVILLLAVGNTAGSSQLLDVDISELCVNKCRSQTHTDHSQCEDQTFCDQKCEEGCKLWKSAVETSCEKACNVTTTIVPKTLYCILGCNEAISLYGMELQTRLGDLPAPALVADSLTATSLRLEWNFALAHDAGVRYFLQYEEREDAWQYCRNQSWGAQDTVFVDNLEPYTKYRFRVVLLLTERTEPIVSPPSVVISTLPDGVPASPPGKVRAVPVDSTRITVSWEPGPFPHGPLLSYVLRITDSQPNGYSALKDLPAETKFFMCKNLNPNSNYTVSISMRNGIGAGPPAVVTVATPKQPKAKHSEKPILILGANHVVIEQGTDMIDEPVILYNTNNAFITGVAIHVSKKLLFVADSDRNVYRLPLHTYTNHRSKTKILSAAQLDFLPLDLSMDWLNEHLYILGEVARQDGKSAWQIARCNLTGGELTIAIAGLLHKPTHFEVDPYNGYLFWGMASGIYRLDLADVSNGIKHEVKPFKITGEKNLGAFTIDHEDFKILVAHQVKNTVISISFDGKEVMNMRPKATRPRFEKVLSLATANDILYWTNGVEVYFEEHHPDNNYYFHNSYPLSLSNTYSQVLVNLTSSQSTPIPLNPPINVETIFGTTSARISWQVPHILGWQGKGAWRNWSYDISIKDMTTHNTCYVRDINTTSHTIHGLTEDTEYVIKTLAYTMSGNGPWSTEFVGRTLKTNPDNSTATILWSGIDGLLQSDVTGENIETIIHCSSNIGANVTDIAWYEDLLFLVTNTSQLLWYNTSSQENGTLSDIDSVRSVSLDWVGKKLYWCNPKQQMIIRGNLNGTQREHIKLNTLAKELHVDSINGYLYWSTGHTLECSRLNGENHFKYHESQMFSGLHVMGLTLDMRHKHIYWIVRGSDHSDLFRAPMAGTVDNPLANVTEYKLRVSNLTGPLCYFNNRLIWLQDDKSAMISDLEGKNTACIRGKNLLNLNTVYVKDSALHLMPNASKSDEELIVIPAAIDVESISVVGTWNSFHIEWEEVTNVNYGVVFYEIKVDTASRNDSTKKATTPSIQYWHSIPPYTMLHISVRAFTYWGASVYTKIKLHSPPSVPQAPCNPRAFVTHDYRSTNSSQVNVTYRWDAPDVTNGVLQGYHIMWWHEDEEDGNATSTLAGNLTVEATVKELVVENLLTRNYTIQVAAFTEIGEGDFSMSILVDTSIEKPIPKILVAAANTIYLKDMDTFTNATLHQSGRSPIQIGYLYAEQKIFWINDMNEMAMLNFSRMVEITGSLVHLTVDWLERSIYYLVHSKGFSTVFKLDLNLYERGIVKNIKIVEMQEVITKIEVSPFERTLYWLQWNTVKSEAQIVSASVSGKHLSTFIDTRSRCDCPKITGQTFTVDSSLKFKTQLLYLSSDRLIGTDDGCKCRVLTDVVSSNITSISADFNNVFWSDTKLHMLNKNARFSDIRVENTKVNDVLIYGSSSQPYPAMACLKPANTPDMKVSMVKRSSNTLTLKMPDYQSPCNTTMATVKYIIYYAEYNMMAGPASCDESCIKKTTFDTTTDIISLRPYTKYVFAVALTNHFSDLDGDAIVIGPGVVFQTDAGAPTPPRNVRVDVLNPTLLSVRWEPPASLNGDFVYYEVHWQTEGAISGVRHKGEQRVLNPHYAAVLTTKLQTVSPNETYSIWIRAYSHTNETSSDSKHVTITTFPLPEPIRLVTNSATELCVQWNVSRFVDKFTIQYTLLTSTLWMDINETIVLADVAEVTLKQLKPKTPYKFRLSLKYPLDVDNYIWPKDSRIAFETLGDRPSPPGIPRIQHVKNDVYKVWWEPSKDNGAAIIMYHLETLKTPNYRAKRNANRTAWFETAPSIEEEELSWESIYNGTDSFWMFSDLLNDYRYSFRVSAVNSYGWSDYSEESLQFDLAQAAQMAKKNDLAHVIIPISVSFGILVFLIIGCKLCCWMCKKSKKEGIKIPLRGPDVELATLRELPRILNNTNILYRHNQIPDDISMLPHISRDKITLVKFLGSGAFGEVFQGKAKGLSGMEGDFKVAVKTLRKGASETEKFEFLQEAQLMSHFKHEHILELLGVVLDNDPHYIIMELMEGGDLLSYLRNSRKPESNVGGLNLLDLLKMCVDVAKGCRYLEEMHFVHRDLACRNCLVSSTDPSSRIVKIGDFGLARDIYKNDYYRKEGEGLLPVRWMAPESLVDGVFTCQSDVWAFGVLLWEIMTLGQQPYPARNNLEVLHYVRRGGRLGQPTNCPEVLHNLMLKCWETEPERRPTFKYCLDTLERLHLKMVSSQGSPMTGAHIGQYVSTVSAHLDGISNRAYYQDENHNHSANSVVSGSEEETSREQVPFLRTHALTLPVHTYLDILHDSDSAIENDGYEVPRGMPFEALPAECDKFEQVVNDLTMIEHLLKPDAASVDYTNMNIEQNQPSCGLTNL